MPEKEDDKLPEMESVTSSNVNSIGFCPDRKCIFVEFANGGTYKYSDCDRKLFDDLKAAESLGSFIHREIKKKPFTKVG